MGTVHAMGPLCSRRRFLHSCKLLLWTAMCLACAIAVWTSHFQDLIRSFRKNAVSPYPTDSQQSQDKSPSTDTRSLYLVKGDAIKQNETQPVSEQLQLQPQQQKQKPMQEQHQQENRNCLSVRQFAPPTNCSQCLRPRVTQIVPKAKKVNDLTLTNSNQALEFFRLNDKIIQPLITNYLITPSLACHNKDSPYLLIVQPSVLDRTSERDVVRNTWAPASRSKTWPNRTVNASVKVLFVVSHQNTIQNQTTQTSNEDGSDQQWRSIQAESIRYDDILYLDMIDSYQNLTLKLMSAFKWVKEYCPCIQFILKVDFDTFVNVPLLVDTLLAMEQRLEFSILGSVYPGGTVRRKGRWGVREDQYSLAKYPAYASGCGYVISARALFKMVDAAPYTTIFNIEDAYITGVLRRMIGCDMFSLWGIFTFFADTRWEDCAMFWDRKILGTTVNESRHRALWRLFEENGQGCTHS